MLWNRESAYHLTKQGAEYLQHTLGIEISPRAAKAIKPAIQLHEYELSRFWLKWIDSSKKLNLPLVAFYRDGSFKVPINDRTHYIPDGVILHTIRGKTWAFLLELDRSTQSASTTFRKKLEHFQHFTTCYRKHPIFQQHGVTSMKLMVVCKSQQRADHLRAIAKNMGFQHQCAFTTQEAYLAIINPSTAHGWEYKRVNLLNTPIFHSCGRDPTMFHSPLTTAKQIRIPFFLIRYTMSEQPSQSHEAQTPNTETTDEHNAFYKQKVRTLNDLFRTTLLGGTVLITQGVQALGKKAESDIVSKVRFYNSFDSSNDPHEEHDFGVIKHDDLNTFQNETIFWKIDYYDLNKEFHSSDPSDSKVTHRVLTIMHMNEY